MITVVATILAKPEFIDKMKAILEEMALTSRNEEPCIKFDVLQKEDDQSHFFLHEEWKTKEGFQAHFETEHFKRLGPQLFKSAMKHPETIVLNKIV